MSDHDFNTPPWFCDLVRTLHPKGIGLDPCGNEHSYVGAKTTYTIETNGLAHSWRGHGLVFMNPPHSLSPFNIEPWVEKTIQEFVFKPLDRELDPGDGFVGLVPAKTSPLWFHSIITECKSRCFLRGRIKFWHLGQETAGPGKFDSLVIYIGHASGNFKRAFEPLGWVV